MQYRLFCNAYGLDLDPDIDPDADVDVPDRVCGIVHSNEYLVGYLPQDIYDTIYESYCRELETNWVHVQIFRPARVWDRQGCLRVLPVDYETTVLAVPPTEPACSHESHEWQPLQEVSTTVPRYDVRGPVYVTHCQKCGIIHVLYTEVDDPFTANPGYTYEEYVLPARDSE